MKTIIRNTADVPKMSTGHSTLQFIESSEESGSKDVTFLRGTLAPGGNVPLHSHADVETFFLLDGTMDVYVDEGGSAAWQTVPAGGIVTVASNTKHAWRNVSPQPCECFVVTGADVYRYLKGACDMMQQVAENKMSQEELLPKLLDLAKATHGWLATPEENAAIGLVLA